MHDRRWGCSAERDVVVQMIQVLVLQCGINVLSSHYAASKEMDHLFTGHGILFALWTVIQENLVINAKFLLQLCEAWPVFGLWVPEGEV